MKPDSDFSHTARKRWPIALPFYLALSLLSFSSCGQGEVDLSKIESALSKRSMTVSDVLTSEKYLRLHANPDFRNLMRKFAPQGNVSIVTAKEPGTRIQLRGRMIGKDEKPRKNVLFYFYHTMHDGLYAENVNANSQRESTLFGFLRTDDRGEFQINTIKPAGYPGEKFPSHVHLEIYDESGKIILGTEFQFNDDPRLDKEMREASVRYGNLIAENTGTREKPVYYYTVRLPDQ